MEHNITITIDDKIHKLTNIPKSCEECSLHDFCTNTLLNICPAIGFGGGSFVELKVEK